MGYKRVQPGKEISIQFVQAALHILDSVQELSVSQRNRDIVRRAMEGESYESIGRSFGISAQRVNEIAKRLILAMHKMPTGVFQENDNLRKRNEELEQELYLARLAHSKFCRAEKSSSGPVDSVLLRDCEMSTRLKNILDVYFPEVKDVWSLSHLMESDLKIVPRLGRKTLLEIRVLLGKFHLRLADDR